MVMPQIPHFILMDIPQNAANRGTVLFLIWQECKRTIGNFGSKVQHQHQGGGR